MLPDGDIYIRKRDPLRIPTCHIKSGQAGRETSRDGRMNLGNEGIREPMKDARTSKMA